MSPPPSPGRPPTMARRVRKARKAKKKAAAKPRRKAKPALPAPKLLEGHKREPAAPAGAIVARSKRNDWQTPPHIIDAIRDYGAPWGGIAFDPATARDNPTRARRYCAPHPDGLAGRTLGHGGGEWIHVDGLAADWRDNTGGGLLFTNPPYGAGGRDWVHRIAIEALRGVHMLALLGVARTEQHYFCAMLAAANVACFVRGRVAHRNPDTGDMVTGGCYASWLLGFNVPSLRRFREHFEPLAGTSSLQKKGARSLCVEMRAL